MSNVGKWEAWHRDPAARRAAPELTHRLAADYLAGCPTVEDWGCGTQRFRAALREFAPACRVVGLDGSAGGCDRLVDLSRYVPEERPDGIVIRHVLEHNHDWRAILDRALAAFRQRLVLVLFTPMSERETHLFDYRFADGRTCPYLALPRREIEALFRSRRLDFTAETIASPATEYGRETVYRVARFPLVSCLCPTYRRPRLLANALACFEAQDYPAACRELVILDDGGTFPTQAGPGWQLVAVPRRFRSLPEKYNALAGLAEGDLLLVWEDDDVYLPWHVSAHVEALADAGLSKPSRVVCDDSGTYRPEEAGEAFHASLAFRRDALCAAGGWPVSQRNDFDRRLLAALDRVAPRGDPCRRRPPSYVYRWATGAYHGQALMRDDDEGWYARAEGCGSTETNVALEPRFDAGTRALYAALADRPVEPNGGTSPED